MRIICTSTRATVPLHLPKAAAFYASNFLTQLGSAFQFVDGGFVAQELFPVT
jgi:hypothetical protein